ncbi:unnamed protein product [Sympodiomycopsis kandeliae]
MVDSQYTTDGQHTPEAHREQQSNTGIDTTTVLSHSGASLSEEEDAEKKVMSNDKANDDTGANFATHSMTSQFDRHAAEVLDEAAIEAAGQSASASLYVWLLTGVSALIGFLFGYDTGAINSVLVQIGTDIDGKLLSSGEKELLTSSLSVGGMIGAVVCGYMADTLGRKRTLVVCDVLFIVGAVLQASISSKWPFAVGRLIMGLGVGCGSMIAPMFISEIAPVKSRGMLSTLNVVAITGGQVIATAIGAGFEGVSSGWRWIIAIGAFPPFFQAIIVEFCFPESPRHLQRMGKTEQAKTVLARMYPRATPAQIEAKSRVLQNHIKADAAAGSLLRRYKDIVTNPPSRRAAFLAFWLQASQQLSGFNSLMYYSATIFALAGLKNATATSLVVSGVNFVMSCFAVMFIDRFGRRNFLKVSTPVMIFGLLFSTVVFHYMTAPTGHLLKEGFHYDKTLSSVLIFAMVIFVAGYAAGIGQVPWSTSDLFDQSHRGVGASIGAFTNWSFNLLVSSTFLRLMNSIRPAPTFGLYAALSFLGGVGMWFFYPETLSLSLEQTQSTLEGGFNVKRSEQLRKQNLALLRDSEKIAKISQKALHDLDIEKKPVA